MRYGSLQQSSRLKIEILTNFTEIATETMPDFHILEQIPTTSTTSSSVKMPGEKQYQTDLMLSG